MQKIFFLLSFTFICSIKANTILVSSTETLLIACKNLKLGDTILLHNGIYNNVQINIHFNSTENKPILIKAKQAGHAIISGDSFIRISGSYINIEGLHFKNGYASNGAIIEFRNGKNYAYNCRISNCSIENFNNKKRLQDNYWIALYGKYNRIDHCTFKDKLNLGVLLAVMLDDDLCRNNSHSIDSNKFLQRVPLGSNGGEIIRVGVSQHCTFNSNTTIKNNLFEGCDGETEIVSIKSGGNFIRDNIFKECQGSVVLRHGNNNTVEGNTFWGNNKRGTGGVRIINEGNWVVNNLFLNCKGIGFKYPLVIMNGVPNSPPNRYLPVRDAVVSNNTFINCTSISFCEGSDTERSKKPENVYFINNYFENKKNTDLLTINDDISGITVANNYYNYSTKIPFVKGFSEILTSPKEKVSNTKILPDSIAEQVKDRLILKMFHTKIGSTITNTSSISLANIYKHFGASFFAKTFEPITSKVFNCYSFDDLVNASNSKADFVTLILKNVQYTFTKPLEFNQKKVVIVSNEKKITLESSAKISAFFIIIPSNNFVDISINQCNFFFKNTSATCIINTSTEGFCNQYNCNITYSSFNANKQTINNFLIANKSAFAQNIAIYKSTFTNFNGNIFQLNNEVENKGFYPVEIMRIQNNKFSNIQGYILHALRGGNDESTMGPKLNFSQNTIVNCQHNLPLVYLEGIQETAIKKNTFSKSNSQNYILKYKDWVRASHTLKNNIILNSGNIITNKYVQVNTLINNKH